VLAAAAANCTTASVAVMVSGVAEGTSSVVARGKSTSVHVVFDRMYVSAARTLP